jgi:hypothetical protein
VRVWTLFDLRGCQAISQIPEWCNNASYMYFGFFLKGWGKARVLISGSVAARPMVAKVGPGADSHLHCSRDRRGRFRAKITPGDNATAEDELNRIITKDSFAKVCCPPHQYRLSPTWLW